MPVGGIPEKVEAAIEAGCKKVIVPKGNEYSKQTEKIQMITVKTLEDLLILSFQQIMKKEV